MDVPNVSRTEYQLVIIPSLSILMMQIDIDEGFLSLMTAEGATKDDVKIPEGELGDKIRADFDDGKEVYVSITKAMNEEACLSHRVQ
jgi:translation initiation factor 5A